MNEANEVAVSAKQIAVKDSETELMQKQALALVRKAELRVAGKLWERYLGYVKDFARTKLSMTEHEYTNLSVEEIKAIDFLMVPRAKKICRISGLINLLYVGGVTMLTIFVHPAWTLMFSGLLFNFAEGWLLDQIRFLQFRRRGALKYLKNNETEAV